MGAEHSQESDQGGGFAAMCCRNSTRERRTVYDDWKSRRGPHDDEIRSIEGLSRRRAQENWGCVDGQSTTTADNCEWGCAEGDTASRAEERGGQNLGLEDTHFIEPQKEEQKTMAPMPLAHRSAGAKRGMSRPPQTAQKEFAKAERIYQQQHADLKSAWSVHNQKAKFYQLVNQVSEEDRQIVRAMTLQRSNKHYLMEGKVIKETMKQPYAWSEQIYNSWAPAKETSMNVGTVRNIGSSAKKYDLHKQREKVVQEHGVATLTSDMSDRELVNKAKMIIMREKVARREREALEKESAVHFNHGKEAPDKNKADSRAKKGNRQ